MNTQSKPPDEETQKKYIGIMNTLHKNLGIQEKTQYDDESFEVIKTDILYEDQDHGNRKTGIILITGHKNQASPTLLKMAGVTSKNDILNAAQWTAKKGKFTSGGDYFHLELHYTKEGLVYYNLPA